MRVERPVCDNRVTVGHKSHPMRKPSQSDLELVVGHFLHYLSNEPDRSGISPRLRFYGMLPVQAKLLFPDVDDEVFVNAVKQVFEVTRDQRDIIPNQGGSWRSYS
jgi:hypothetical protein